MVENIYPIDYALRQCTAVNDPLRPVMNNPFRQGEVACATDGHVLLRVNNLGKDWLQTYKTEKSPDTSKVIFPATTENYKGDITLDHMMLNPISEDVDIVEVGGIYLKHSLYDKMFTICCMLGLDGWAVYQGKQSLLFKAEGIEFLIMGLCGDTSKDKVVHEVLHRTSLTFSLDLKAGASYCQQYAEQQQRKAEELKELKAQRHGYLWKVQVEKYAYFYVEAADKEEAKDIARHRVSDVDDGIFDDSDIELEGVQGQCTIDDVYDEHNECIFADGEWMDKDEYEDTVED